MFEFFQGLGQNIIGAIVSIFSWLGNFISDLFDGFKEFTAAIFRNLLLFFNGIWYLLTKCFDIVVLSVQVVLGLFKVLMSIIVGIFHTFTTLLGFSGSSDYFYLPLVYQKGYSGVADFLDQTGINTMALIMVVFIWIATAYAIIRIAGGER